MAQTSRRTESISQDELIKALFKIKQNYFALTAEEELLIKKIANRF